MRTIAIYSDFTHHSKNAGYKQILKFTKPVATYGIDYHKKNHPILRMHYFFHEFIAWFKSRKLKFDIVHILYGEDYFRFSSLLFRNKKIVVTFHQPPDILNRELSLGNYNGRIAGLTHALTRRRLKYMDAAIVMSKEQKEIAAKYIDPKKIHVIPLGVELNNLNQLFNCNKGPRLKNQLITVGEWLRDWDLYFKIIEHCHHTNKELEFILINNRLSEGLKQKALNYPNVKYLQNVPEEKLYELYLASLAMFLPLKSVAGSNAINESLALGCPVISNVYIDDIEQNNDVIFVFNEAQEFDAIVAKLQSLNSLDAQKLSEKVNASIQLKSWQSVSNKLISVYNQLK
jgi:glycosyltransferase involved in cell wall biosynthesis